MSECTILESSHVLMSAKTDCSALQACKAYVMNNCMFT